MKMKKALVALVCAIALVTATFLGTMAYFTSQDSVTNTFTVGKVEIKLDEANVDNDKYEENDKEITPTRDKANDYHLIPGMTNDKDPMVTVLANSEDSYVRMIVKVKDVDKLEKAFPELMSAETLTYNVKSETGIATETNKIFLIQELTRNENNVMTWNEDSWPFFGYSEETKTEGEGEETVTTTTGIYEFRHKAEVKKPTADTPLDALFTDITVPGALADNAEMQLIQNVEIKVEAHAIQADGFNNAEAAWAAWN